MRIHPPWRSRDRPPAQERSRPGVGEFRDSLSAGLPDHGARAGHHSGNDRLHAQARCEGDPWLQQRTRPEARASRGVGGICRSQQIREVKFPVRRRVINRMGRRRIGLISLTVLAALIGAPSPSMAITGTVRVTVAKGGFIVGAGGGKGILTFRHRNYPFTVQGLSVGLTAGASINKLVGRAEYINELSDFAGTYNVVGAGGALIGGVGGVQLRNGKGVTITLQGPKGGLELSANVTKVVISLDQSRSTPD